MTAVGRDSDSGRTDLIQAGYRIIKEISILDCKNILTTESKIHNCNSTYYVGDKCGSQAGTGGKGGRGGHTGDIYLFDLTAELAPITHMTGDGANGIDGRAGSQGTHPKKLLVKYYDHSSELRFNTYIRHDWIVEGEEEDESCPKLEPVADGGNAANQKEPDSQLAFEMTTPILEYLSYLRAMQIDHMRSDELNTFAQQIQTNEWILRNFTILGFINEVQSLENQFFEYQNSIDFAPYYRAVCQRIEDYVAAHASIITPESRKVRLKTIVLTLSLEHVFISVTALQLFVYGGLGQISHLEFDSSAESYHRRRPVFRHDHRIHCRGQKQCAKDDHR